MNPLDARPPFRRIEPVRRDDHHRSAVAPGIVDGHRRVQQANSAVDEARHRLARDLCISVRDCGGNFLVNADDQFRRGIAAMVDDRFVQASERGARHRRHIFDIGRFE